MTTDQLKELWNKGSKVKISQARSTRRFPTTKLSLYGPGTDSGTFDFFTDEINGEEGVTREDYEASEDDNQLVTGVSGDEGGLGYFGFSYYEAQRRTSSTSSASTTASGCVKPSSETIQDGTYKPLSRPLFMYPSAKAHRAARGQGASWTSSSPTRPTIAKAAKIVPLTDEQADRGARPTLTDGRERRSWPDAVEHGPGGGSRPPRRRRGPDQPGPDPDGPLARRGRRSRSRCSRAAIAVGRHDDR